VCGSTLLVLIGAVVASPARTIGGVVERAAPGCARGSAGTGVLAWATGLWRRTRSVRQAPRGETGRLRWQAAFGGAQLTLLTSG